MGKRDKSQKKESRNPKKRSIKEYIDPKDMDDEIDTFHKHRDIIPLDIDDRLGESSEDDEEPVFDDKAINDDDDSDDDDEDNFQDTGFAAKIARQKRFLEQKFGKLDDEMHDDEEDEDKEKEDMWDGRVHQYYGADTRGFEDSSDDERLEKEEEEAQRIQRERAKSLTLQDFGLGDESDRELTLEKKAPMTSEVVNVFGASFEETREEETDAIYSSAPDLVGLQSELNNALEELETRVNPLLSKLKAGGVVMERRIDFLEVKQLALLAYCQAITFYFLLKFEGQSLHDHPVIARLVEIKELLDKINQLDQNLPLELEEDILKGSEESRMVETPIPVNDVPILAPDLAMNNNSPLLAALGEQERGKTINTNELTKIKSLKGTGNEEKRKRKSIDVDIQSSKMLKIRASLEAKLKQKGVISSNAEKPNNERKYPKLVNRQFETYDDFIDDDINVENGTHGSKRLSQLVTDKRNKQKVISGDDDLPKRDDIGERRMKFEMRALARTGVKVEDDDTGNELDDHDANKDSDAVEDGSAEEVGDAEDSGNEFYEQVEQQRAAKRAAKAATYTRTSTIPSLPETVDGKRRINYQIEKNKGLTPSRPKSVKNPRKKYREKHKKQQMRRKGQVRQIRKPIGSYSGEASGINPGISKSIRFSY